MVRTLHALVCLTLILAWGCGGDDGSADATAPDAGRDTLLADPGTDAPGDTATDRIAPDPGLDDLALADTVPADLPGPDLSPPDPGVTDPGPADPGPVDPGTSDLGPADPGASDTPAVGTKGAGEACKDASECSLSMSCIAGRYTMAHCNIQCTATEECLAIAPGTSVTCQAMGGTGVCIWTCNGGAKCPGDLPCDGWFCG